MIRQLMQKMLKAEQKGDEKETTTLSRRAGFGERERAWEVWKKNLVVISQSHTSKGNSGAGGCQQLIPYAAAIG